MVGGAAYLGEEYNVGYIKGSILDIEELSRRTHFLHCVTLTNPATAPISVSMLCSAPFSMSTDTLVSTSPLRTSLTKSPQKDYSSAFGELQTMYGFGGTAPRLPSMPENNKKRSESVSPASFIQNEDFTWETNMDVGDIPNLKYSSHGSPYKSRKFWKCLLF